MVRRDEVFEAYRKAEDMLYVRAGMPMTSASTVAYHVDYTDIGSRLLPRTVSELRACLQHIMEGLSELESINFVHRDIRWPNILWFPDVRRWKLIDLDFGAKSSAEWPADISEGAEGKQELQKNEDAKKKEKDDEARKEREVSKQGGIDPRHLPPRIG
jgi:serine/threonine protein kinase